MTLLFKIIQTLFVTVCMAYIIPAKIILQKTIENNGTGVYSIEQEVVFSVNGESFPIKETWLIENDRTMRLTAKGFQDQLNIQFIYNGNTKYFLANQKMQMAFPEEQLERLFHFRSYDSFLQYLNQKKIISQASLNSNNTELKGKNTDYISENFVRLSRSTGVVNYAIGNRPEAIEQKNPGIWIEQDQFVIRKFRWPSGAEVMAQNYTEYGRRFHFPKERILTWGDKQVTIKVINVSVRSGSYAQMFQVGSLDLKTNIDAIKDRPGFEMIKEFYSRFR